MSPALCPLRQAPFLQITLLYFWPLFDQYFLSQPGFQLLFKIIFLWHTKYSSECPKTHPLVLLFEEHSTQKEIPLQ